MNTTSDTSGAKIHARNQANTKVTAMPTLPASSSQNTPEGWDAHKLTWSEVIKGGGYTSKVLARGTIIRFTDIHGKGCLNMIMYRADAPWERLNVADTVKVPWQAYLTTGHPILSDQGRILATVIDDTSKHHDNLCGSTTSIGNTEKYGDATPQSSSPSGESLFTLACAKNGLGVESICPSISFFHGIKVDTQGNLISTGNAPAGSYVELMIHLPVIMLLANTAHPLDPNINFETTEVSVHAHKALNDLEIIIDTALSEEKAEINPEYYRAVLNTEDTWKALNGRVK